MGLEVVLLLIAAALLITGHGVLCAIVAGIALLVIAVELVFVFVVGKSVFGAFNFIRRS